MSFVRWHYRNGHYVRSHYRRAPRRAARDQSPSLFALTASGSGVIPAGSTERIRDRWSRGRR